MKVEQIYAIVNGATQQVLGETAVLAEDLHNVVDMGTEIINANAVDNYVKTLVDRIGKVIFVNRPYSGTAPSVLMDGWEYGSVLQKIQADIPEAVENKSWTLTDGTAYPDNVFHQPKVTNKFFNSKVTFEVDQSFTTLQLKESFTSASDMNAFLSMIYNAVEKSITVKMDSLILSTIGNMIAQTFKTAFASVTDNNYSKVSDIKAFNLLKAFNEKNSTTLTAENAISNADFIRYASYVISLYSDRMARISKLYNLGGKARFTPKDLQHIVLLSDFAKASEVYLQSDTYHKELVQLPNYESIPYWQGTGTAYDFASVSTIDVKTQDASETAGKEIKASGIIGVIFDRDSLGVANLDRRTTTSYNASAEFYTNYFKFDSSYFNDANENFVVFFIA